MAVTVKETKAMLKTVLSKESDGIKKKRAITIRNINPEATKDNLSALSNAVAGVVQDDKVYASVITEEIMGEWFRFMNFVFKIL